MYAICTIGYIANYIKARDTQPTLGYTTYRNHTSNVNLKLAFHKVASFHPHYLKCTPQTYHHPVYQFRSWPMQTTSPSHPCTQARVHPRNTYNYTYISFCLDTTNQQPHTKSRQNLHCVHAGPCRIYEQSGPNNIYIIGL